MVETFAFGQTKVSHVRGLVIKPLVYIISGIVGTSFQDNGVVIDWVNEQPLKSTLTCK